MSAKHPAAAIDRNPPTAPDGFVALQVSESEILKAIRSFPAGSAASPDRFSHRHLLYLVNSKETGPHVLTTLTSFANTFSQAVALHRSFLLFSAATYLLALEKRSGVICPIAVGYILPRLTAKYVNSFVTIKLVDFFIPTQLRAGIPGGCRAAVHAIRPFIESMQDRYVGVFNYPVQYI